MNIYAYLIKAVQDDARRAGERDRLLLEARQARRACRQRLVPAAPLRRRTARVKIVDKALAAGQQLAARLAPHGGPAQR